MSPSAAKSSGRSFDRGEKVVRMLARSFRRLGSVVWLCPAPVTSAECKQALESGIVEVNILDFNFLHRLFMCFNLGQRRLHISELPFDRQRKRRDRAFHTFKHVDAEQVDQTFLSVHLAEEALAATNLCAVFGIVGRLLVRKHISQRSVRGESEAADLIVDLADDRRRSPTRRGRSTRRLRCRPPQRTAPADRRCSAWR